MCSGFYTFPLVTIRQTFVLRIVCVKGLTSPDKLPDKNKCSPINLVWRWGLARTNSLAGEDPLNQL